MNMLAQVQRRKKEKQKKQTFQCVKDIRLLLMQSHHALIFAVLRPPEGRRLGLVHFLENKTKRKMELFNV